MNCPDCGGTLGVKATQCRCGWGKKVALEPSPLGPNHVQCAADAACRKPGRISPIAENLPGYGPKDRICVDHFYALLERVRGVVA